MPEQKILNIGLPRTGTYSLTLALRSLGYTVKHYPSTINQIASFDAATEVRFDYESLEKAFPNSLYICTTRKYEDWIVSCHAHKKNYKKGWNPFWQDESNWEKIFLNKIDSLCFFDSRPQSFLLLDICAGEGWEKLCTFLQKPIPTKPFPNTNKSPKGSIVRM